MRRDQKADAGDRRANLWKFACRTWSLQKVRYGGGIFVHALDKWYSDQRCRPDVFRAERDGQDGACFRLDHLHLLNCARVQIQTSKGEIIEISYNSIVFGLLVMEATPGGEGILVIDTDLEVDFAAPVGYVEPERPKPAPPATMASKLNIDVNQSTPGSSRPQSSMGGQFAGTSKAATAVSKDGDSWESFKGRGETLAGRKTKGRGISHRGVEQVPESSKIQRTEWVLCLYSAVCEDTDLITASTSLSRTKILTRRRTCLRH